ncbi:WGxxGxxG family protein [Paenibacillus arenilitoris]|uniref:WGxxGxxG-CTERM domain-containing protein n=1 Tax=Paenibacillus arenilitoris TaxID=2772299 RepID=A0A927CRZ0_9BACL|nr:WGxxGxxG family protein [Paenibacillus arenilitoris]MBD2872092.1 WGxxGxxG-CTERM domain-containing protein [Paenibacillus arenilitoris]
MKKTLTVFSFLICMLMLTAVPAFADNVHRNTNNVGTYDYRNNNDNNTFGEEMRQDINRGITNTNRALGTDIDHIDRANGMNGNRMGMNGVNRTNNLRTNNVRATAAADNDGFDWGWLGLLGLIGLAGLRSRDRERT